MMNNTSNAVELAPVLINVEKLLEKYAIHLMNVYEVQNETTISQIDFQKDYILPLQFIFQGTIKRAEKVQQRRSQEFSKAVGHSVAWILVVILKSPSYGNIEVSNETSDVWWDEIFSSLQTIINSPATTNIIDSSLRILPFYTETKFNDILYDHEKLSHPQKNRLYQVLSRILSVQFIVAEENRTIEDKITGL
jgi:hypothetical protein